MYTILPVIIYIAFISLGLPDSILGSAWPTMYEGLQVPVSYMGIVSMIIAGGTIISSLFSDKVIYKLGTGKVTAVSVGMTAVALLGFSGSNHFWQLCLWGIPYGLGAGSVDAALNNYVAVHYKAKHMSWLHCFWGIGATLGPYIMGLFLAKGHLWNKGYLAIAIVQIILAAFLFCFLALWKEKDSKNSAEVEARELLSLKAVLGLSGAKAALISFFCYCAIETTTGLWAASYLVFCRGLSAAVAAKWAALFYLGITIGRFVCGFITMKLTDKQMVRLGQCIILSGILLLFLPFSSTTSGVGLVMIGLGCAPIYPSLLHATPSNFGKQVSQSMMGIQMASAYVGSTFIPPLFGVLERWIDIKIYPLYLLVFLVFMVVMVERMNTRTNNN